MYKKLYPTGSCPVNSYGNGKIHNILVNGNIDDLHIRPIVSSIKPTTYNLAKYLSRLSALLGESEYIIKSTKDFVGKVKEKKMPNGYQIVSFDVKSLFTNVVLDWKIDIILKTILEDMDCKHQ